MVSLADKMMDEGAPAKPVAAVKASATKLPVGRPQHVHPAVIQEEVYWEETPNGQMRRARQVTAPPAVYLHTCKACQLEDAERRDAEPQISPEEFDNTLFLIPAADYSREVCTKYMQKRYPGATVMTYMQPEILSAFPNAQIVVVTRKPGPLGLGPAAKTVLNPKEELVQLAIPAEEYLHEVVESAPIKVSDGVLVSMGTMFTHGRLDLARFSLRLGEVAAPCFFIADFKRGGGQGSEDVPVQRIFELRSL